MPRDSGQDREVADGPWPRGLNDASDTHFIGEGEVPFLIDCDVSQPGGLTKRNGLAWTAGLPGTNGDRAVCILIDFLHDGRVVLGVLFAPGADSAFDETTSRLILYALPVRQFISETAMDNAVVSSTLAFSSGERFNSPTVVRLGGRTYITALGNILKWEGDAWAEIAYDATAPAGEKDWDTGMKGYWTRANVSGVPEAVSDSHTSGFQRVEPSTDAVADRQDDTDGGGGFPDADLISLFQVGDRQVVLTASGDKVRYSFPTPYGAGSQTGDSEVYGPQDWLQEAWLDLGESGSYDYVTAFQQVQDVLFVFKRSSIWMVYGNLAPGGLRVQKLHSGVGARHSRLVTVYGNQVVFFDLVTSSLWSMSIGGELTDLWDQRITTDASGDSTRYEYIYNSFVQVFQNKVYASLPTDGDPKLRTYVTDMRTGAVTMWSYGTSFMVPVEFYGFYGLFGAIRITGHDGGDVDSQPGEDGNPSPFLGWIVDTTRQAPPYPTDDELTATEVRIFTANVRLRTLIPSVPGEAAPDWHGVNPKWRRGLLTVSATDPATLPVRFNGVEQSLTVPEAAVPIQVWTPMLFTGQSTSMDVDVDIPDGVTLHRVAMRYWRRR